MFLGNEITLLPWQERALTVPAELDLVLEGSRGGGKTTLALFIVAQMERLAGAHFSGLMLRQDHQGTVDIVRASRLLFHALYNGEARFNQGSGIWTFPNGGTFEINQVANFAEVGKYIGRNFNLLIADQCEMWATMDHINLIMSSMRAARDVPRRCVWLMNSGGVGHAYCKKRWITPASPWAISTDGVNKRQFVRVPSNFMDNTAIDRDDYRRTLEAATAHAEALRKAWIDGDWDVAKGAYFADVFDERRNVIDLPLTPEDFGRVRLAPGYHGPSGPQPWRFWLGHDWGSAAPSHTLLGALSPGIRLRDLFVPRDSVILLDEVSSADPVDLSKGLGWGIERTADEIKAMLARWNLPKSTPVSADDACFARVLGTASLSIADQFRRFNINFIPAMKGDRVAGWTLMREMLLNAGKPDRPGLYIHRACQVLLETMPSLPRDPRNVNDVDSRGVDHPADSARYLIVRGRGPKMQSGTRTGF